MSELAIFLVIGVGVTLLLLIIVALFLGIAPLVEGAAGLWHWAAEWGFVGFALFIICWVLAPILMVIVCLVIGLIARRREKEFLDNIQSLGEQARNEREQREKLIAQKETDRLYAEEPLSEYERRRGF